eukprot:6167186-Heterocapsa_arctica.AAC.1
MGGQGRGVEGRDQRTVETEQPGTDDHQRSTGNSFVAAGVMEDQREGRVQEGNVVPPRKTDLNAKGYQKMRDDIRIAYAELEEIGWNQVISDQEEADG